MGQSFSLMAKIHPQTQLSSTPCYCTSSQEIFTVWMKSLILCGRGCTVFDSNGQIVYRVDNYNSKCSDEVHVMDSRGNVLFTLLKKKFKLLQCWESYKWDGTEDSQRRPWFQAKGASGFLKGYSNCEIVAGPHQYKMETCRTSKSTCRVVDQFGVLVAEVKRKRSAGGFDLGEDVLTMVVEPCVDHSLVMGLYVVYCLINHRL